MADLTRKLGDDLQDGLENSEDHYNSGHTVNRNVVEAGKAKSDTGEGKGTGSTGESRRQKKNRKKAEKERKMETGSRGANHQQDLAPPTGDVKQPENNKSYDDRQSEPYNTSNGRRNEGNNREEEDNGHKNRGSNAKQGGNREENWRKDGERYEQEREYRGEHRRYQDVYGDGYERKRKGKSERWGEQNGEHGAEDKNWRSGNKRSDKNEAGGGDHWRDHQSTYKGQGHKKENWRDHQGSDKGQDQKKENWRDHKGMDKGQGQMKGNRQEQGKYYHLSEEDKRGYEFFYQGGSFFSQWHRAFFTVDGIEYNCTEQYMMHQKAVLMQDWESAEYILTLSEPRKQKEAGREVQNFNQKLWDTHCYDIVSRGNYAKFSQNKNMKEKLLATYPKTLVETNPFDKIWGIGLNMDDPKAKVKAKWRGRNLLGYALTEVRDRIMKEGNTTPSGTAGRSVAASSYPQQPREGQTAFPTARPTPEASKDWFDEESPGTDSVSTGAMFVPQPRTEECFLMTQTTGSEKDSGLLQISAICSSRAFHAYVIPLKPISKQVEEKTGIKYSKNQMTVSGRQVQAVPIDKALQDLMDFLGDTPMLIIGHNMRSMGCHVLINAATPLGLNDELKSHLKNMYDVVTLARHVDKKLEPNMTLEKLSERILGKDNISHDSSQDVNELQKIYSKISPDEETMSSCVFQYEQVMNAKKFLEEKNKNMESWKPVIAKSKIPKKAAEKAAGHGMTVENLLPVYRDGGVEAITAMFTEIDENTNTPKVTDKKEAIHQLCSYFGSLKIND